MIFFHLSFSRGPQVFLTKVRPWLIETKSFNNLLYLYILCVFLYYLFFIPYLVLLSESCDISAGEISQEFLWFLELEL